MDEIVDVLKQIENMLMKALLMILIPGNDYNNEKIKNVIDKKLRNIVEIYNNSKDIIDEL